MLPTLLIATAAHANDAPDGARQLPTVNVRADKTAPTDTYAGGRSRAAAASVCSASSTSWTRRSTPPATPPNSSTTSRRRTWCGSSH
ncbi:hypothetical protein NMB32_18085 [Stenotrophomonas sp. CD2]|nr:hypothetical protein NMB32_18085 [Stenotrophomonas sp. CD2]